MLPQSFDLSPTSAAGYSRAVEAVAAKRLGVLVGDGVCLFIIQHFIWDQEGGEKKNKPLLWSTC